MKPPRVVPAIPAPWRDAPVAVAELVPAGARVRIVVRPAFLQEIHAVAAVEDGHARVRVAAAYNVGDARTAAVVAALDGWCRTRGPALFKAAFGIAPPGDAPEREALALLGEGRGRDAVGILVATPATSTREALSRARAALRVGDANVGRAFLDAAPAVFLDRLTLEAAVFVARATQHRAFFERLAAAVAHRPLDPTTIGPFATAALQADAFDAAARLAALAEADAEAALVRARLALLQGDTDLARRAVAVANPDDRSVLLLEADALALCRDDSPATQRAHIAALEAATARGAGTDDDRLAARLWSTELLLRAGDVDAARRRLGDRIVGHPAEYALAAIIGDDAAGEAQSFDAVAELVGHSDPWEVLARLGGNRREPATMVADGVLRPLRRLTSRQRAIDAQHALAWREPAAVVAALDSVAEERGGDPFGLTYGAEVCLWLGDYVGAEARFQRSATAFRARWGFIGWGAALAMQGRDDEALGVWASGVAALPYEATHCYRGELLLRRGDLDGAAVSLRQSTSASPGRLGAWAALGRWAERASDGATAAGCRREVETRAPALAAALDAWFATRDAGASRAASSDDTRSWFATCLRWLRGNRSSHLYTWYDADDRWRAVRARGG